MTRMISQARNAIRFQSLLRSTSERGKAAQGRNVAKQRVRYAIRSTLYCTGRVRGSRLRLRCVTTTSSITHRETVNIHQKRAPRPPPAQLGAKQKKYGTWRARVCIAVADTRYRTLPGPASQLCRETYGSGMILWAWCPRPVRRRRRVTFGQRWFARGAQEL